MIRKLITACAGVAMMGSCALAVDVTGTYAGQSNGQNLSIQLQERDGVVRGSVRIGGGEFAMSGQERNGELRGTWQTPDGQEIPFAAQVSGGNLRLATNGVTYSLQNSSAPAEMNRQPAPVAQPPQAARQTQPAPAAGQMTVHMEQGQIFARPVPDGWKTNESCNETFIVAPDSSMSFGFTGFEGLQPTTPAQFMQWMLVTVYKNQNFQIIEQKEVPSNEGGVTVEALVTFSDKGVQWKSWIRCNVLTAFNSSNGYILFATAKPENFQNAMPTLVALAEKIQITDVNAVFDRARRLGVIRSVKNNPIPDTIIVGYNERQKIMDNISFRRGEADTNSYHVTNDAGQATWVGNQVIDPNIGGYRDPRTNEVYHLDPRWNGHY